MKGNHLPVTLHLTCHLQITSYIGSFDAEESLPTSNQLTFWIFKLLTIFHLLLQCTMDDIDYKQNSFYEYNQKGPNID